MQSQSECPAAGLLDSWVMNTYDFTPFSISCLDYPPPPPPHPHHHHVRASNSGEITSQDYIQTVSATWEVDPCWEHTNLQPFARSYYYEHVLGKLDDQPV